MPPDEFEKTGTLLLQTNEKSIADAFDIINKSYECIHLNY
jgi:hypothetical protein